MSKADWIKAAQEQKQPELMHMIMTACGTLDAFALVEACGWRITKTHERDASNPLGEHRVVEYASPASHRI